MNVKMFDNDDGMHNRAYT